MTYLSAKSKRNTKHVRISILVIVVLVISFFWKPVQKKLYPVVFPFVQMYTSIRDTGTGFPHTLITFFTSRNAYEAKIALLEEQIERLENEVVANSQGTDSLVGTQVESTSTKVMARSQKMLTLFPVVKDISTLYNSIVLSRGFVDDIEEGMIVYVRGNQAVGYITSIYKTTSLMKLYSASGETIEGIIKDIDASVTLIGQGGGSYVIEVPKNVPIVVGQIVYLAQAQNMPLGTVVSVLSSPQDIFTKAYISGSYNPNKAHIFYVNK